MKNRNEAIALFNERVLPLIEATHPDRWMICGSYRRGREMIKDMDILIIGDYDSLLAAFTEAGFEIKVGVTKKVSDKMIIRALWDGFMFDFMFVHADNWGAAAMHHTGPVELNIMQRWKAQQRGGILSQWGFVRDGVTIARTEEEVYEALGMKFITPEDREGWAKVKVAA